MSKTIKRILIILCGGVLLFSAYHFSKWGFLQSLKYSSLKHNGKAAAALEKHVKFLAKDLPAASKNKIDLLDRASGYIKKELEACGYKPELQNYSINGQTFSNVTAFKQGKIAETLVIGAHYDTYCNPGADDNSSGVAVLLEVAKAAKILEDGYSVIFVAFTNEEPPNFKTENMGSYVFAKSLKDKNTNIKGAVILESVGYYSNKANSQNYPPMLGFFYPNKGDFLAVVSNFNSNKLAKQVTKAFNCSVTLPVSKLAAFDFVPGVDFSDNWSFWKFNYPAVMLTDTAFYRNKNYHKSTDLPETLNYGNMAEIAAGLEHLIKKGKILAR